MGKKVILNRKGDKEQLGVLGDWAEVSVAGEQNPTRTKQGQGVGKSTWDSATPSQDPDTLM